MSIPSLAEMEAAIASLPRIKPEHADALIARMRLRYARLAAEAARREGRRRRRRRAGL